MMATQLLVVPRSMPMTLLIVILLKINGTSGARDTALRQKRAGRGKNLPAQI
jgi:hypothetical protein